MQILRRVLVVAALVMAMTVTAAPAWAQVDFSGEWAPRFWEDQPERVPGPELGDYLGIPINEAARMRGDTWDAAIQTLPEWQCRPHIGRLHLAWAVEPAHLEGGRSGVAHGHRVPCRVAALGRSRRSIWTAGRIRPKARCTRGPDSRPRNGTATCSPSRRRI